MRVVRVGMRHARGFASVAEGGNHLTEDEQFAKLRLVADTARAIWARAGNHLVQRDKLRSHDLST